MASPFILSWIIFEIHDDIITAPHIVKVLYMLESNYILSMNIQHYHCLSHIHSLRKHYTPSTYLLLHQGLTDTNGLKRFQLKQMYVKIYYPWKKCPLSWDQGGRFTLKNALWDLKQRWPFLSRFKISLAFHFLLNPSKCCNSQFLLLKIFRPLSAAFCRAV